MPQELILEVPGLDPVQGLQPRRRTCVPPAALLVLLAAAAAGPGLSAEAGMAVWPKVARSEDTCDNCEFVGGTIDQLTINDQPARLQFDSDTGHYDVWRVDDSGTPMYAETSGLNQDRVLDPMICDVRTLHPPGEATSCLLVRVAISTCWLTRIPGDRSADGELTSRQYLVSGSCTIHCTQT